MASTDLATPDAAADIATVDAGAYIALNHSDAEIQEIIADNLGGQDVDGFDLTRITVPSGGGRAWEVETLEGLKHWTEIEGIIVHTSQTRTWWPIPLDEQKEKLAPSCSSPDAKVGFGKQWATKADPNPDGEPRSLACNSCPHGQWGSGKNGGQACQLKGQWYMLLAGSFLPVVVTLPPMSLKPAKQYMLRLASSGIRYSQVVTKLHLEPETKGGNTFGKVIPELIGHLSKADAERSKAFGQLLAPIIGQTSTPDVIDVQPTPAPAAARPVDAA